jgi:cell pole-organizing protein PopZ
MTQPAKVTEPSMEEILASIRRIIADDEAKPPPAEAAKPEKAAAPAAPSKPQAISDIPPSKVAPAKPAAEKPRRHRRRPPHLRRMHPTIRTISTRCWQGSTRPRLRRKSVLPSRSPSLSPTCWN